MKTILCQFDHSFGFNCRIRARASGKRSGKIAAWRRQFYRRSHEPKTRKTFR